MSPIIAVKAAIRSHLAGDAVLVASLGGAKIHDEVPRGEAAPYIVFAEMIARENGSATDRGHLIECNLHVWSRQGGSREALAVADLVAAVVDDATLPLTGHRMIHCRVTATETRRTPDKDLTRVQLRLRIVTEVL
jgi:hypothetical protein